MKMASAARGREEVREQKRRERVLQERKALKKKTEIATLFGKDKEGGNRERERERLRGERDRRKAKVSPNTTFQIRRK